MMRKYSTSSADDSPSVSPQNASAQQNGAFPDFHHKMSKKIAQLTKVIYHLNTKNDDHEFQIKHLTDTYEHEIEEVYLLVTFELCFIHFVFNNNII